MNVMKHTQYGDAEREMMSYQHSIGQISLKKHTQMKAFRRSAPKISYKLAQSFN
jgi:hypothetical protein